MFGERILNHGRVLEDSYIVGDAIARGQFSTVYKCLYKGKTERACRTYEKIYVNCFKVREQLEEIKRIFHPNLIRIYEGFETENEIHFITDRVYGEELFERIVDLGHYSEREASSHIRNVLLALKCLHERGIPHGDIRPESLLYSVSGSAALLKLRDVSFSRWSPNTHTVVYIAPEKGESPTMAADLWSLGIVIYIMLCGIEPAENEIFTELVPGFSLPWWDDISDPAKRLIQRMLDLDPSNRLTASEALESCWVSGHSTKEHHLTGAVERLKEFNARRKFRAASKAILATRKMTVPFQRRQQIR